MTRIKLLGAVRLPVIVCMLLVFSITAHASAAMTASNPKEYSLHAVQLRNLVAEALAGVAMLRTQVHDGKNVELGSNLMQLNTMIRMIKAARPNGELDALVDYYKQHLSFEDNKLVLADIMPLYKALDAMPDSNKIKAARRQLDEVRSALQSGKRAEALTALQGLQRGMSVGGLDFPLLAAEEKLRTITTAYDVDKAKPAQSDLLELETYLLQVLNALA